MLDRSCRYNWSAQSDTLPPSAPDIFRKVSIRDLHYNLSRSIYRLPGHPSPWCSSVDYHIRGLVMTTKQRAQCLIDWLHHSSDAVVAAHLANMVDRCVPICSGEGRKVGAGIELAKLHSLVAFTEQQMPLVWTTRCSLLIELTRVSGHVWETYGDGFVSCNDPPRCLCIEQRQGGITVSTSRNAAYYNSTARDVVKYGIAIPYDEECERQPCK
ncbi:hypothetical protein KIPB_011788 [Kipferlia bialata]|uniref:Uncharacterized protein n=1 Tax=Kipferlia bialata TaxID=797122 RepID=A0A9K3D5F3_9EUKA|nr:hypothetical protein KIPB_011788 [Kipferlia bialata]|eukprot:g11788.t1